MRLDYSVLAGRIQEESKMLQGELAAVLSG